MLSIEDLDRRFHSWLESEYHRSPHRGLAGKTPLEAWLEKAHHIIPMDPMIDLTDAFLHECSRKVYKDSTITIDGVLFEVPSSVIGERIKLRYDPHVPTNRRRLQVFHQGQYVGEARLVDSYANTRVHRGYLKREVQITDTAEQDTEQRRRPVDNSLSASRFHIDDIDREDEK